MESYMKLKKEITKYRKLHETKKGNKQDIHYSLIIQFYKSY